MEKAFLESYLDAFGQIEGWFSPDAAIMFMAYNGLIAEAGIAGDVLEIGVHHGLSTIGLAAMRGERSTLVAVDLFEQLQEQNVSASGSGNRVRFEHNMARFFGDTSFVRCIASASSSLSPGDLGNRFSFCHVDGGHTAKETYEDLRLCSEILLPGGLLALDDYFNPKYPGVCEGAIKFWLTHDDALAPVAAGFNKVLFQRTPAPFDVNAAFRDRFPYIARHAATLWETPIHLFGSFAAFIDTRASNPRQLVANEAFRMNAELTVPAAQVTAPSGGTIHVPVRVINRSSISFVAGGESPFGLSYHLLSEDGRPVRFDNRRSYFWRPLAPGEERIIEMAIDIPEVKGRYTVEADIVWEGITWLKERGLDTPSLSLLVI